MKNSYWIINKKLGAIILVIIILFVGFSVFHRSAEQCSIVQGQQKEIVICRG